MSLVKKKPVIEKAIKKFGKLLNIKRSGLNKFDEPISEADVVTIEGFYYRGNNQLSVKYGISGEVKSDKSEKLMVIIDDKSELIKEGDYFYMDNNKYEIIDMGNSFDLYYDITLKKVT